MIGFSVFNLFVSHISTQHYFRCALQLSSLTISTCLSISVFSHARCTCHIEYYARRGPFFSPLPCGTKIFVKQLIRIVDGSVSGLEDVVHQEHSSQTSCFVVPSLHTPSPMQSNVFFPPFFLLLAHFFCKVN